MYMYINYTITTIVPSAISKTILLYTLGKIINIDKEQGMGRGLSLGAHPLLFGSQQMILP